ncbi:MAG: 5-(carboxyamino)imidazole ribonucleotide synthase [Candidatus Baltobacteraceae bacterium]
MTAGRTIGILGGGQLGRMLTLEAKRMGYRVVTLEPFPNSPTGQVADEQIVAAYDDARAIGELGARSDVVTYEFENIPLASVEQLENDGRLVLPNAHVLRIAQDRILEKTFVRDCGIATTEFAEVGDDGSLARAAEEIGFPGVLKTTTGGYDGKNQWLVRTPAEAEAARRQAPGRPLIWERFVPFERELSIIVARNANDQIVTFPLSENEHDHGVLATSIVPGRVDETIAERARESARIIARKLGIVGTFCVEFFLTGERLLVNEIAPRVHNSGHYSLDATQISQYETHVRAICGLPLVEPRLFAPAVMANILGTGEGDELAGLDLVLRDPDLALHLYGKAHAALRRKMGHFTVLGRSIDDALARAVAARSQLHWTRRS